MQTSPLTRPDATATDPDFQAWQLGVECRAILPLKWAIWLSAVVFWLITHTNHSVPPLGVFALFTAGFMANVGFSYLLWGGRVSLSQVPATALTSYVADVVFVTALVIAEFRFVPAPQGPVTDFHLYYFVLALRGFSLFRTNRANLVANLTVGLIFLATLLALEPQGGLATEQATLVRGSFIWLMITLSWMIVQVLNNQKEELIRARERIARGENLAMVGKLAGMLAHELNNPVAIISAHVDYLQRQAAGSNEELQTVADEARRCARIVSGMLAFTRLTPGEPERILLHELFADTANLLTGNQVAVEVEGTAAAWGDRHAARYLAVMLLFGARNRLGPDGGTIRIRLIEQGDHQTCRIELGSRDWTTRGFPGESSSGFGNQAEMKRAIARLRGAMDAEVVDGMEQLIVTIPAAQAVS